jgi:hypothetical protein
MLAYILLACLAVPLLLLIGDVLSGRKSPTPPPAPRPAPRPRVTADPAQRGPQVTAAVHDDAPAGAPRPPRIKPGDGMVYRGPARR